MSINDELVLELQKYGIHQKLLRILPDEVTADSIDYRDLIQSPELSKFVSAVVEDDGKPLMYVVNTQTLNNNTVTRREQVNSLAAQLACRGTVAYLCLIDFGQISIFPCGLIDPDNKKMPRLTDVKQVVHSDDEGAADTFQKLLQGHQKSIEDKTRKKHSPLQIRDVLKDIFIEVCERLIKSMDYEEKNDEQLSEILSLVGRAIFVRFLADRGVLSIETFPELYESFGGPDYAFDTPESAIAICEWLDETFNGEILPLVPKNLSYDNYFFGLSRKFGYALFPLGQIMRKEVIPGLTSLWPMIDFAHVPAGILSEVYETFVGKYTNERLRSQSVYYTPQHVADMVIAQAFNGIDLSERHAAKIVDPAAGAGVFLVLALKKLVQYEWRSSGRRPQASDIRRILYNQICGLDINRHALILAALSLYLTVVELADGNDIQKLKFEKNLIGTVLFDVETHEYPALGTLRPDLPRDFFGQFDMVVGNPPWTSLTPDISETFQINVNKLARNIIKERYTLDGVEIEKYVNPDSCPDIPFVWRAMQMSKPNGIIALLLHARLLFGNHTAEARKWISHTLRIHGIINASSFSDETDLWPVKAPFLMLFASNSVPEEGDTFFYVSPYLDKPLAKRGKIRLDPRQSHILSHADFGSKSRLMRVLYRGTTLDFNIIEKIDSKLGLSQVVNNSFVKLSNYWENSDDRIALRKGVGYKVGTKKKSVAHLLNLKGKDLTTKYSEAYPKRFFVDAKVLPNFEHRELEKGRTVDIYTPPLVLVFERQPEDKLAPKALVAEGTTPIIFNGSFIGISTLNDPEPVMLAYYISALLNSDLSTYYLLMTSAHFGVNFRRVNAEEIYDLPVPRFSDLSETHKNKLRYIIKLIKKEEGAERIKAEINQFVNELYDLSRWDIQVMEDTLKTQLPFAQVNRKSHQQPSRETVSEYIDEVSRVVSGTLNAYGEDAEIRLLDGSGSAWRYFEVIKKDINDRNNQSELRYRSEYDLVIQMTEEIADNSGASFVKHIVQPGKHITVGILAQSRYWTVTRARLVSGEVIKLLTRAMI